MKPWFPMMAAGIVATLSGLFALINPTGVASLVTLLVGWALIAVCALQGWSAYKTQHTMARLQSAGISLATGFLGLSVLIGPFGDGFILRLLIGLVLILSGFAKANKAMQMTGHDNKPIVLGTAATSAVLGILVIIGFSPKLELLLAGELLASGLGLLLVAMHQRSKIA